LTLAEETLLTEKDMRELFAIKCENKNLDYKQSLNWNTATTELKASVIKDVLAMTNTQDGGRIIFGVRDGDFEQIGLTDEEFQSFDTTRFVDFLNRYADPPFGCGVHKFTIDDKKFVGIEVPEFAEVPVICKADANDGNGRQILKCGATYIRTDRAASEVVSSADTMRDLMNRALVRRGDQLLKMVERLIKGKPASLDDESAREINLEIREAGDFIREHLPEELRNVGHWEVEFYVRPYLRERVPNLALISTLLAECQITLRGWYFPHFDREHTSNFARGVQSYTLGPVGHREGYRAYQTGTFVWKQELWEDSATNAAAGQKVLSFVGVILEITEYFLFAKRYYEKISPDATVHLRIRLTDTLDRTLASFNEGLLRGTYTSRVVSIQTDTECTVAELIASYDELARKAIRHVFEMFNWNDSSDDLMKHWQEALASRRF
jgi:hypothetical protein